MKPRNWFLTRRSLIAIYDIAAVSLSLPAAALLRANFEFGQVNPSVLVGTTVLAAVASLFYWLFGLHRGMWRYASSANLFHIGRWAVCSMLIVLPILFWIDRLEGIARSVILIHWVLAIFAIWLARITYVWMFRSEDVNLGRLDLNHSRPVLLVGNGDGTDLTIQMMARGVMPGYYAVGILDDHARPGLTLHGVPIMGTLAQFKQVRHRLALQGIELSRIVLGAKPERIAQSSLDRLQREAETEGLDLDDLPTVLVESLSGQFANKNIKVANTDQAAYEAWQRSFDLVAATAIAVVCAPLLTVLAVLVRATIHQDVIFSQSRPGAGGRYFWVQKFSTMSDPFTDEGRKLADEDRTPLVGQIMRRTRIDELPQLWNVFRGEMSLIGPRPLLPLDLPNATNEQFRLRYSVRPGITGWAQVNGGNHLTSAQKLAMDLWYIQHRTILLDLVIIAKTVTMMFFGERINPSALNRAEIEFARAGSNPISARLSHVSP